MLGRLRMSVDQALMAYGKLLEKVFSDKKSFSTHRSSTYKAKNLREALQSMVRGATGNEGERMIDKQGNPEGCKT
jgi:hypothetical protein